MSSSTIRIMEAPPEIAGVMLEAPPPSLRVPSTADLRGHCSNAFSTSSLRPVAVFPQA